MRGVEIMKRLRCVIVDDEPIARYLLRSVLENHPDVEVVAEAGDVESAAKRLGEVCPDLVFLDIQMPGGTGFDVLRRLGLTSAKVVFVTAHDEFAVKAFNEDALDYLLKPIEPDRVASSIARVRERNRTALNDGPSTEEVIQVSSGNMGVHVRQGEVAWISSDANYSRLETFDGRTFLIRQTLLIWSARLPTPPFLKLDRGSIINIRRVVRAEFGSSGGVVFFTGGRQLALGRKAANRLRFFLGCDRLGLCQGRTGTGVANQF